MSDHSTPRIARPWTEGDLNAALHTLCPPPVSSADLADLRAGLFGGRSLTLPASSARVARLKRLRGRKAVIAAGSVVAVLGAGTVGVSAANGVFDNQAQQAFATTNTYPWRVDANSEMKRATARTPDGGIAELWTATSGDRQCFAILLDDPGRTAPGKPYRPGGGCDSDTRGNNVEFGGAWFSNRTNAQYMSSGGRTVIDATTVTFTSLSGPPITAPAHNNYFLAFLPSTNEGSPYNGLTVTDRHGHTHVLTPPSPLSTGPG